MIPHDPWRVRDVGTTTLGLAMDRRLFVIRGEWYDRHATEWVFVRGMFVQAMCSEMEGL